MEGGSPRPRVEDSLLTRQPCTYGLKFADIVPSMAFWLGDRNVGNVGDGCVRRERAV
jgi:hypothetical protein